MKFNRLRCKDCRLVMPNAYELERHRACIPTARRDRIVVMETAQATAVEMRQVMRAKPLGA
jgi:hypothetical protein